MRRNQLAWSVAMTFQPDVRHGPGSGCPFCGIQFGHLEGCTSPNLAISVLPTWPRMKQHPPFGERKICDRCGKSMEWLVDRETRPIYGDTKIYECVAPSNDPGFWVRAKRLIGGKT